MLKPIFDHIVVKPDVAPDKSAGGIYISEGAKEKPQRGTVVAVGPGKSTGQGKPTEIYHGTVITGGGRMNAPMPVAVGDVVLYGRYGGTEVNVDGEDVVIMRVDDVLAVVEA